MTVNHTDGYRARVTFWKLTDTGWQARFSADDGRIGYGGLVRGTKRKQGTGTTPLGTYALPWAFGMGPADERVAAALPRGARAVTSGCRTTSRRTTTATATRPRAASAGGCRRSDPDSSERLTDFRHQYRIAVVTDFNINAGPAPRRRHLPARQRRRCDRRLRERPGRVHGQADAGPRPGAGPGHRGGAVAVAKSEKFEKEEVFVDVEGRTLKISNLGKVLYPRTGTTKGEVLNYYAQIAPVHAAAPQGPGGHPDPLAARRRGHELLREEHPRRYAVLGAHRDGADHRRRARRPRRTAPSPSRSSTTWPPSPGWSTWPRSSCTCTSGRSAATGSPATPTAWSSTSTPASRPGCTSAAGWRCSSPTRSRSADLTAKPVTSGSKGLHLYADLPKRLPSRRVDRAGQGGRRGAREGAPQARHRDHDQGPPVRARSSWTGRRTPARRPPSRRTPCAGRRSRTSPRRSAGTRSRRARRTRTRSSSSGSTRCWSGWRSTATCSRDPAGCRHQVAGRPGPRVTQHWCSAWTGRGLGVDTVPLAWRRRAARDGPSAQGGAGRGDRTGSAPVDPRRVATARARSAGPCARGAAGAAARRCSGLDRYVVTDRSMDGSLARGSVVLAREVPTADLEVGDVITFRSAGARSSDERVTRRIVAIEDGVGHHPGRHHREHGPLDGPADERRRTRGCGWACPGSATRS